MMRTMEYFKMRSNKRHGRPLYPLFELQRHLDRVMLCVEALLSFLSLVDSSRGFILGFSISIIRSSEPQFLNLTVGRGQLSAQIYLKSVIYNTGSFVI